MKGIPNLLLIQWSIFIVWLTKILTSFLLV